MATQGDGECEGKDEGKVEGWVKGDGEGGSRQHIGCKIRDAYVKAYIG